MNLFSMLTLMGARIVKLKVKFAPLSATDVAVMVAVVLRGRTAGGVYVALNFGSVGDFVSFPQSGEHEEFARESFQTTPSLVGSSSRVAVKVMGALLA